MRTIVIWAADIPKTKGLSLYRIITPLQILLYERAVQLFLVLADCCG